MKTKTKSAKIRLFPTLVLCVAAGVSAVFSAQASADTYHVVVPAPGKAAPYAAIQLELSVSNLPKGKVGVSYGGFSFLSAVTVNGDPDRDLNLVTWSAYSGTLPQGLTLTKEGSVVGTPTMAGASTFQVLAKYKTKSAVSTYQLVIDRFEKQILAAAGARTWDDGSVAPTCKDYRNPSWPYVYEGDTGNGVYTIKPAGAVVTFNVYCDMTTDGGGWTTIQRRFDGSVDFFRGWTEYVAGFGAVSGEHWLGLENIRVLTATPKELRIDMGRGNGQRAYAKYTNFALGTSATYYYLRSASFAGGTTGDSLTGHVGYGFSTKDADHDSWSGNCAQSYKGAWWYSSCMASDLNGPYNGIYGDGGNFGLVWYAWTGHSESLVLSEMKVR